MNRCDTGVWQVTSFIGQKYKDFFIFCAVFLFINGWLRSDISSEASSQYLNNLDLFNWWFLEKRLMVYIIINNDVRMCIYMFSDETCSPAIVFILLSHDLSINFFHELLFRCIFETQIHIQTQIWKYDLLSLATNDFL